LRSIPMAALYDTQFLIEQYAIVRSV